MMDIARLLYARACSSASGVLYVYSRSGTRRVELRQGWVYAIDAGPSAPARPEAQLRYVMRLRAPAEFHQNTTMSAWRTIAPFHPAPSIRNHTEAQHFSPEQVRRRIGQQRIAITLQPHPSCIGWDEKPLVAYMSQPHTLREIEAAGICPPTRTIRLIVFLEAVGALSLYPAVHPLADAYALLGLIPGATQEQIKSAYRRLARELHPDVHPNASTVERNALAARFAAIHAAYRRLST
jgi:DnaJ-domain-containing protein 1